LPLNVGAGGFNGHRVYGAVPFLVHSQFVAFLDEDNWFDPDHLARLMAMATREGLTWAYALRKIVDREGVFVTTDDCESLGHWPVWYNPDFRLVDANCYLLRREVAVATGPHWHRRFRDDPSPDYLLCKLLLDSKQPGACSGHYTVNYRAGMSADSVRLNFFLDGNAWTRQTYGENLPWRAKDARP
jgi:glycosyltransferase involved in cell wall biosynthesis